MQPGSQLGAYTVQKTLGQGGMGTVYKALHRTTGRTVALKVISGPISTDESFRGRFEREGRAAATVAHANVTAVYDAGEANGQAFIAFEYVEGTTLKRILKTRGRLPWQEAVSLGAQVARALAAVHAAGLVHRDLKPENVLLDSKGLPKLSDFGLVGSSSSLALSSVLTRTGEIVGTLEYMAPEQANAAGGVDARADLYSLGATLYALLTGSAPFRGEGYALVKKHLLERPRAPSEIVAEVPEALDRLVLSLLEKKREDRPASAALVASRLEALGRRSDGVPARPRRSSVRLVLGGAVVVALASVAGVVALVASSPSPVQTASPAEMPPPKSATAAVSPRDERAEKKPRDEKAERRAEARRIAREAIALIQARRQDEARGLIARALELDPGSSDAWLARGHFERVGGDSAAALVAFDRAVDCDPENANAWSNRSQARLAVGDKEGALAAAERAIAIGTVNVAWAARADAKLAKGDFEAAIRDYTTAIERDPKHGGYYFRRGRAQTEKGDIEAALADYGKAVELEPRHPDAWAYRGWLHQARGEIKEAIDDFDRAIELAPLTANHFRGRGVCRQMASDDEGAARDYEQALALDPNVLNAQDMRRWLSAHRP